MNNTKYKVGDAVKFGRPNGAKQSGKITKINPKSVKIDVVNPNTDRIESWRVSYCLVYGANEIEPPQAARRRTTSDYNWKVGQKVTFGRDNGAIAEGDIIKVNLTRCKVKLTRRWNSHAPGKVFNVPFTMLSPQI